MLQRNCFSLRRTASVLLLTTGALVLPMAATAAPIDTGDPAVVREIALDHLSGERLDLGLSAADIADVTVRDQHTSRSSGAHHLYLQQRHEGIPVYNGLISMTLTSEGRLAHVGDRFHRNLARNILQGDRVMDAREALTHAASALDLELRGNIRQVKEEVGAERLSAFTAEGLSASEIPARLVYQPLSNGGLRLAWHLILDVADPHHWWSVRIDAESGQMLDRNNLVAEERYETYAWPIESPNHTTPAPPADARSVETDPFMMGTGSPLGWHDTNNVAGPEFTITRGNNVHAYADRNADNAPDGGADAEPDGGGSLDFTGAVVPMDLSQHPNTYVQAAVANLFYWSNIIHDVLYEYGFDEGSGNFQVNNYGNGGLGNDDVRAEAQDGGGNCNANFGTPPDGSRPRMQMFTCTNATPVRDGDFDHGVVAHEYGHGVSNRLTGGPAAAGCLGNAEQMGEGWSDYLGLMLTMEAGDAATDSRGTGTYLFGQAANGGGIRPAPYNTNTAVNNFTYDRIDTVSIPHGVGFVWATMLWDMTWNLIDQDGLNADIYDDWTTGGNNLALQLVMDGMKLQPCSPGFVDGRDAILAADDLLTGDGTLFSGANQCPIWDAFAGRGLGASASQGSSFAVNDGTEAFDMPAACTTVGGVPSTATICAGDVATYRVGVGTSLTPPVSLSTSGEPGATTTAFSTNPVMAVPGTTDLTLSNTGGLATGDYSFTVTGTGGGMFNATLDLSVFDSVPSGPGLTAPANGTTDEVVQPSFSWSAVANTLSYTLEVDDDPGFGSIDYTASGITGTSHAVVGELDYNTTYYWRVRADNPCGASVNSATYSFTTAIFPGDCLDNFSQIVHFEDDLESGTLGWTSSGPSNTWQLSGARVSSGASAWWAEDLETTSDQRLVSPPIALPNGVDDLTLQFATYQAFETPNGDGRCWDAGVLEISTDNGASWNQVPAAALLTDPYDNVIWNDQAGNNPITNDYGATDAWCNELQPYLISVVDLSAYSGTVRFAWRLGSDGAAGNEGWYIDDVSIRSCLASGIFEDGFNDGTADAWSFNTP